MVIYLEQGANSLHCPADATTCKKPHLFLPRLNPDWFYLSRIGLARLTWKTGHLMCVVVLVLVVAVVLLHYTLSCD